MLFYYEKKEFFVHFFSKRRRRKKNRRQQKASRRKSRHKKKSDYRKVRRYMSIQEYIETHNLSKRVEETINAAVKAKAPEPISFMVGRARACRVGFRRLRRRLFVCFFFVGCFPFSLLFCGGGVCSRREFFPESGKKNVGRREEGGATTTTTKKRRSLSRGIRGKEKSRRERTALVWSGRGRALVGAGEKKELD